MKKNIKKLSQHEVELLRRRFEPLRFNHSCELVYEQQVPNTGIVLLSGEIALMKRRKVQATVGPGTMLGVDLVAQNQPSRVGCKVSKDAELIMLNRSEILEALNEKDPELYAIIKEDT